MRNFMNKIIEKLKSKFNPDKEADKPPEFEQKLRKLMHKKNFDDSMISYLMYDKELIKLDCDYKKYLYDFVTEYIEVKEKIMHEDAFITEEMIVK